MITRYDLLYLSGASGLLSIGLSGYLISRHQKHMIWLSVQSKICAIVWMVPIYSMTSFLSLLFPVWSLYIDMLRDCYEAYVLYTFMALMLAYLNCDDSEPVSMRWIRLTNGNNCDTIATTKNKKQQKYSITDWNNLLGYGYEHGDEIIDGIGDLRNVSKSNNNSNDVHGSGYITLIAYLERQYPSPKWPFPFKWICR